MMAESLTDDEEFHGLLALLFLEKARCFSNDLIVLLNGEMAVSLVVFLYLNTVFISF